MAWHTTTDLGEFDAATLDHLVADRARHTLHLTTPEVLRRRGASAYGPVPPWFGWHSADEGRIDAVFVHTPPHPLILTDASPSAIDELVDLLAADPTRHPSGVNAPNTTAEAVAAAWHARTGAAAAVSVRHRLYRLGTLTPPDPVPAGAPRVGTAADSELLVAWYHGFAADAGATSPADVDRIVADRIAFGGLTLWEVDGTPVAMAGAVRPVAGSVRVAPVYTPRELRGRGYAGAVTAEVSRQALAAGADEVLLFTDLANPTSNSLYQRLGYREVDDRLVLTFTARDAGE
jgi:GNAT superfamily N-acetyltransferase